MVRRITVPFPLYKVGGGGGGYREESLVGDIYIYTTI